MMTGTEILELAAEGEKIRWSSNYASKVCAAHGLDLEDYFKECVHYHIPTPTHVDAADLLGWMGY